MDIQNHFYGHSAVYAAYCGLRRPRHIAGLVQHGWSPLSPVTSHFADLAASAPAGGLFAWTHSSRSWNETKSQQVTGFVTTAIGSPFLYLLDMVHQVKAAPPKSLKTVVIPFHGTRLTSVEGDHSVLAREVLDREGPSTVCMHIDDLQRPDVANAWRAAGHHLTSAGARRDPYFLSRILWLILSAERVVSNRLATAIMYAAAAGTPTAIYGPHFQLTDVMETVPEDAMRVRWPEFYEASTGAALLADVAAAELGRGAMRSPDELRSLLGWQTRTPLPFLTYWLGAPREKALSVLGWRQQAMAELPNKPQVPAWYFLRHPLEHLPKPLPAVTSSTAMRPAAARIP